MFTACIRVGSLSFALSKKRVYVKSRVTTRLRVNDVHTRSPRLYSIVRLLYTPPASADNYFTPPAKPEHRCLEVAVQWFQISLSTGRAVWGARGRPSGLPGSSIYNRI